MNFEQESRNETKDLAHELQEASRRLESERDGFAVLTGAEYAVPPIANLGELAQRPAFDLMQVANVGQALGPCDLTQVLQTSNVWHGYISNLATHFGKAFFSNRVGIKLSKITGDQCRLFHIDFVRVRLILTLAGPGTQFLLEKDINRAGLGQGDNDLVIRQGADWQNAATSQIHLMRGERWRRGAGLVHRSPAIEGSGLWRLTLTMDLLD